MMSSIITKAKQDDRILAAYMKGLRTNPKVPKDIYREFEGCCNEFFWCICDVSKGIARDEMPFAMTTYNLSELFKNIYKWRI